MCGRRGRHAESGEVERDCGVLFVSSGDPVGAVKSRHELSNAEVILRLVLRPTVCCGEDGTLANFKWERVGAVFVLEVCL